MYSKRPNYILGFHACDASVKKAVINKQTYLKPKRATYHWLGEGVYFWENNYDRAIEFADEIKDHPHPTHQDITTPSVVGAILSLGNCLDLLDSRFIRMLEIGYGAFSDLSTKEGLKLIDNSRPDEGGFPRKRELDYAVIQTLHEMNENKKLPPFDSVRGVFFEGGFVYPGGSFYKKTHIQICVRNPNCIKGYFDPLEKHEGFDLP